MDGQDGRPRPLILATSPSCALPSQERRPHLSIMLVVWWVPGALGDVLRPAPQWAVASARPILPRYLIVQLGGCGLLITVADSQPLP